MCYRLMADVQFVTRKYIFPFCRSNQTVPEAHEASHPVDTGEIFLGKSERIVKLIIHLYFPGYECVELFCSRLIYGARIS